MVPGSNMPPSKTLPKWQRRRRPAGSKVSISKTLLRRRWTYPWCLCLMCLSVLIPKKRKDPSYLRLMCLSVGPYLLAIGEEDPQSLGPMCLSVRPGRHSPEAKKKR